MKGLLAPQNTFLDTIATRFDGTREYNNHLFCCRYDLSARWLFLETVGCFLCHFEEKESLWIQTVSILRSHFGASVILLVLCSRMHLKVCFTATQKLKCQTRKKKNWMRNKLNQKKNLFFAYSLLFNCTGSTRASANGQHFYSCLACVSLVLYLAPPQGR